MARILVVEDDPKTVRTVRLYLEQADHTVTSTGDGATAIRMIRAQRPDLVILDLMLPEVDGYDVARLVRADADVPIIMVTARTREEDTLAGFEVGADDYLQKPFSPRELVARVSAVLRRRPSAAEAHSVTRPPLVSVDRDSHTVTVAGRTVGLTPSEFRLVDVLAGHPGRVFPRAELVDRVMGIDYQGVDRSIDTHISNARRKMHQAAGQEVIVTVHGVGYKVPAENGG